MQEHFIPVDFKNATSFKPMPGTSVSSTTPAIMGKRVDCIAVWLITSNAAVPATVPAVEIPAAPLVALPPVSLPLPLPLLRMLLVLAIKPSWNAPSVELYRRARSVAKIVVDTLL